MTRTHTLRALTAPLIALALTGCGITNPYQHAVSSTTSQTVDTASHTTIHTPAGAIPASSARAVLRDYARLSINWTSHTLAAHQRQLARLACGGARAQALQTATTYGTGSTLQKSGVANHGQITSIAPGQGPATGQWVITTRETTTGRGDYHGLPAQPHVYQARVIDTARGWTVSTWSPQS